MRLSFLVDKKPSSKAEASAVWETGGRAIRPEPALPVAFAVFARMEERFLGAVGAYEIVKTYGCYC